MHFVRLLLPFFLFLLAAEGLSEETQLLCKQNAIYAGRSVERDIFVNLNKSRLRDKLAGVQCKRLCQDASLQSDFLEFREVCH